MLQSAIGLLQRQALKLCRKSLPLFLLACTGRQQRDLELERLDEEVLDEWSLIDTLVLEEL